MATNPTIEQRLQVLEDKAAIVDLKYRYFQGLDHRKPDEVRDIFDPEQATIDFGVWGKFEQREEFIKMFISDECRPVVIDTHHGHNIRITLTGPNTASGIIDLYHAQVRTDQRTYVVEGAYYHEEYVRHSGRWWIKKLVFRVISEVGFDILADGTLKIKTFGRAG
jgi:hypothetical protein